MVGFSNTGPASSSKGTPINLLYDAVTGLYYSGGANRPLVEYSAAGVLTQGGKQVPAGAIQRASRHVIQTQNSGEYGASGGGGYAVQYGYTDHMSILVPGDFTAVRFMIRNPLSAAFLIPQAAVASLPSMNAVLTEWNAATWSPVTWSAATSVSVPGTGAGFAAGAAGFVWSDWIPLPPVTRTDSLGPTKVVGVRVQRPASGSYDMINNNTGANSALFAQAFGEPFLHCYAQNVDGVSVPANFTSTAENDFNLVGAIQSRGMNSALTICGVGDSTVEGTNGVITGLGTGYIVYAAGILRAAGLNVATTELAHAGATLVAYTNYALAQIPNVKPDICFIQPWSPNQPPTTQGGMNTFFDLVLQVAEAVRAAGGLPVLLTAFPNNAASSTVETFRRQTNNRVRASGYLYLDNALVYDLDNGNGTSQYQPGTSVDGVHPSEASKAECGARAAALIQTYAIGLTKF